MSVLSANELELAKEFAKYFKRWGLKATRRVRENTRRYDVIMGTFATYTGQNNDCIG